MPDNVSRDEVAVTLLPCPFCGGEAVAIAFASSNHGVRCRSCLAGMPGWSTPERAAAAWNTRLAAIATQPASDGWRGIESAARDCVTEVDLWCTSDDGDGWTIRGCLMSATPDRIKRDELSDYFPHENGGWLTHWRPLPPAPGTPSPPSAPGLDLVARTICVGMWGEDLADLYQKQGDVRWNDALKAADYLLRLFAGRAGMPS